MKQFIAYTILLSFLLWACANQAGNGQSEDPVFMITVKNQQDRVNLQHENGAMIIDINSSVGIGSAEFELESGAIPQNIVVQLHIGGLEEFRLSSEQTTIAVSVASSSLFTIYDQRIISSGKETPIASSDSYWMSIRVVSGQSTPKVPLENGYFEITVPKEFIDNAGNSFQMQWIDFYR